MLFIFSMDSAPLEFRWISGHAHWERNGFCERNITRALNRGVIRYVPRWLARAKGRTSLTDENKRLNKFYCSELEARSVLWNDIIPPARFSETRSKARSIWTFKTDIESVTNILQIKTDKASFNKNWLFFLYKNNVIVAQPKIDHLVWLMDLHFKITSVNISLQKWYSREKMVFSTW